MILWWVILSPWESLIKAWCAALPEAARKFREYKSSSSSSGSSRSTPAWRTELLLLHRLEWLWHYSAAPPDYTALLSTGRVTHTPYHESAPSEPSRSAYSLVNIHAPPPPSAATLPLRQQAHPVSLQWLRQCTRSHFYTKRDISAGWDFLLTTAFYNSWEKKNT